MTEFSYEDQIEDVRRIITNAEDEVGKSINVSDEDIDNLLDQYVKTRIDPDDAVQYVAKDIFEKANIPNASQFARSGGNGQYTGGGNELLAASEIQEENQWIQFEGTVIEVFENSNESIIQQGRIADETGAVRFTIWANEGVDAELELGESYHIGPVAVNEFQGEYELTFRNVTEIEQLEGEDALDIDPETYTETISGAIVGFQDPMGLIDRCPDCGRVLQEDTVECPDCGEVEPVLDLRTKAIIDTGEEAKTIFLDEEQTEELCFINLEEAQREANEYGDRGIVTWMIKTEIHGEYLRLHGRNRGRRFDVEHFELIQSPDTNSLQEIKAELEALA